MILQDMLHTCTTCAGTLRQEYCWKHGSREGILTKAYKLFSTVLDNVNNFLSKKKRCVGFHLKLSK